MSGVTGEPEAVPEPVEVSPGGALFTAAERAALLDDLVGGDIGWFRLWLERRKGLRPATVKQACHRVRRMLVESDETTDVPWRDRCRAWCKAGPTPTERYRRNYALRLWEEWVEAVDAYGADTHHTAVWVLPASGAGDVPGVPADGVSWYEAVHAAPGTVR